MNTPEITIGGYFPGAIGQLTELHAVYYHGHWGFDLSFEAQVGRELSCFLAELDPARDLFLAARTGDRLAGALAIDGHSTPADGARLRWFIVRPEHAGRGLGARLLTEALDFARRAGHRRVYLWTFRGLDCARRLYERAGFQLAQEHPTEQWGGLIPEQRFDLEIYPPGR